VPRSYGIDGEALSGMDIAQDILECNKTLAAEYTKASLEAADPNLRRSFRQMGRDCERVAYRAFEVLHERGHYDVKRASQQECRQIEEMLESFQRGAAVPNASANTSTSRWSRSTSAFGERGSYAAERSSYASDRPSYASERTPYASDRPSYTSERSSYGSERAYASERTPVSSERTSFAADRTERSELPEWARARS